jgi:ribonuclease HII
LGKAIDHEVEGTHPQIGGDLAKKYGENTKVINAIMTHHGDGEPTCVESVLVAAADAFEVDRLNILEAARLAMHRAVIRLNMECDYLLVDAVEVDVPVPQRALIHGDALCFSIAAASILAKVSRDAALLDWDRVFPEYGLGHNKGYATPDHLAALERLGPTALHRFSFEPVRMTSRYSEWTGYPIPQQGELFACP